jgi:ribose 5-phosphate isomerase
MGEYKMKTKKKVVKKAKAAQTKAVDAYGFEKGSTSSKAVKMLASGKTLKETRKKFNLSFSRLRNHLEAHGFKVSKVKDVKWIIVRKG